MQLSLASPEHLFGHDMWYHLLSHFQLAIMLIAAAVCLAGMLWTSSHWHVDSWNHKVAQTSLKPAALQHGQTDFKSPWCCFCCTEEPKARWQREKKQWNKMWQGKKNPCHIFVPLSRFCCTEESKAMWPVFFTISIRTLEAEGRLSILDFNMDQSWVDWKQSCIQEDYTNQAGQAREERDQKKWRVTNLDQVFYWDGYQAVPVTAEFQIQM